MYSCYAYGRKGITNGEPLSSPESHLSLYIYILFCEIFNRDARFDIFSHMGERKKRPEKDRVSSIKMKDEIFISSF